MYVTNSSTGTASTASVAPPTAAGDQRGSGFAVPACAGPAAASTFLPAASGDGVASGLPRLDQPADRGVRGQREAPVEQRGALLPAAQRLASAPSRVTTSRRPSRSAAPT